MIDFALFFEKLSHDWLASVVFYSAMWAVFLGLAFSAYRAIKGG